ncbi:MAG: cell wall metabolism sensor histidine kinase WalK [Thermosediminibacteraceae bacterium]|nr:cell wall metabolism sensor histidine kinase WalK [Thermosediminibacteraceae bacterium]
MNIKQKEMVSEGQQLIALIVRGIAPSELVDISKFINAYAIVVDRRGLIMACSNKFYFGNKLPIDGSKLSNVLKGKIVVDKGYLPQLGTMLMVALPITRDGNVIGGLILLSPMASMQESISQIRRGIVFVAVGAVVLSTILSFGLSKNITRPLVKMKKVAENMAKGKFDDKVEPETDDEIGTLARTLNFLSDALKENIAALSLEKDQLRNVLLSMTDGVITFDSTGRVLMANPQVWELLGSDPRSEDGEVKALSVLGEPVQKVKKSKKPLQEEMKLEGKILSVRLAPLFNEESEIWGVVAVLQDVTREKKLESLRREFVANVSHELRTPLTYLQGYTEALIDDMIEDPVEQKKYLSIILEETLRLRRLVNDLLDLSLIEAGHLNLKKESFKLNKLIERVLKKVNPVAEKKGVSLVAKIKELPLVLADEDRIEQVLINLIDNALRYTEKGGEITIEASASPQSVVVCVKDQGPGIPEDELPFIWERFHKVDKARTRDNGGTGLGLAIVKGIIEAHGGKVWVKNLEEKGAVFCFSIPYA